MSIIETLQAAWLFAIPLLIASATWWAWASLLRRKRRWHHWMALAVPALYVWFQGQVLQTSAFWEVVYQAGYMIGPLIAGLLLTLAARQLTSLPSEQRRIGLIAAAASVIGLLLMLAVFWSGGDRNSDTVRVILPSIYAVALVLPVVVSRTLAVRARAARWWSTSLAATGLAAAFISATFFFPVEFFNSCFTQTLLPYTLC